MGLLVGLSVWSVAIMVDRFRAFRESYQPADAAEAKALIRGRNWKGLAEWASGRNTLSAYAMRAALELERARPEQIERSVRSALVEGKTRLERGLTVLATLGSNAPFIGLFGTVLGIIQAFAMLSQNQNGMSGVMSGIAEALISTAVGLFVAIPAVVAYNVFSRKLRTAVGECEALRDLYLARVAAE
jgi:biopolymer transport protein ExbB/TolQ